MKSISQLYRDVTAGETLGQVAVQGWIRTNRSSGKIGFLSLHDGSYFLPVQVVYKFDTIANFVEIGALNTGASVQVLGEVVSTNNAQQPFEIHAITVTVIGDCDVEYPLQKKRHSLEYLREIAHLRPRTNTFYAVFKIRHLLSMALHQFFHQEGFIYLHSPIITGNDAEGAGEVFSVTTKKEQQEPGNMFFAKPASLTVSGQLHAESFALAFGKVYTFGPTFRAENSNTSRHASEFWMLEPEVAFADLESNMLLIEKMVKYCIGYLLEHASLELQFCQEQFDEQLIEKLQAVYQSEFRRLTYTEAIEILVQSGRQFEVPVTWGIDLQSEHERYLSEEYIRGPVFLTDYPQEIKAFYMRLNDDGKTVAACDLLVPYVGELVGGSQREERLPVLEQRLQQLPNSAEVLHELQWYLDLRRYGGVPHAGFGLGIERFLMYLTGMSNIRDVLPFPRTPRNLKY